MNIREQSSIVDYIVSGLGSIFSSDEEEKVKEKKEKEKPIQAFSTVFKEIIDNIEGGYYHPNMVKDGRLSKKGGMGDSGETMFGIDRKHGGDINTSAWGVEFWNTIDRAGASRPDNKGGWAWNHKGGSLEPKLKSLVMKMIKDKYQTYSSRYLDPEAKKIVDSHPGLMFHFVYAVWNGPGWFKRFAEKINQQVKRGVKDPKKLYKDALNNRITSGNSLIAQSGNKIDDILGTNMV
jgi:hypothetical protein